MSRMSYDFFDACGIVNTQEYEDAIGLSLDASLSGGEVENWIDHAEYVLGWLNGACNNL